MKSIDEEDSPFNLDEMDKLEKLSNGVVEGHP